MNTDAKLSARHTTTTGVMHGGSSLLDAVRMWPTPSAGAHNESEDPATWQARADRLKEKGINGNGAGKPLWVAAQQWSTPVSNDAKGNGPSNAERNTPPLREQVERWATPSARDWKSDDAAQSPEHSPPLSRQVLQTEKAGSGGSPKVALNPSFVEALMGFPAGWTVPTACAASATPSSPPKPEKPSGN